jgi:hypothetical protein
VFDSSLRHQYRQGFVATEVVADLFLGWQAGAMQKMRLSNMVLGP